LRPSGLSKAAPKSWSLSNLSSFQGNESFCHLQAQQDQLQQHMAQFQQQNMLATSGTPLCAQLPEGGSLNVGGIPRVPSLDLLRQLVQQQQQGQNGAASKPPASLEATGKPLRHPLNCPTSRSYSVFHSQAPSYHVNRLISASYCRKRRMRFSGSMHAF
jgi:hypothetical protein